MTSPNCRIVLASRSPRRRELLSQLITSERIEIVPPASADEAGFKGLHRRSHIEERLQTIARSKCDDVLTQLGPDGNRCCVIAADTVIVVQDELNQSHVLGQPPEPQWQETVRRWFLDYYAGRSHLALTSLCIAAPNGRRELIVSTTVTFRPDVETYLNWYLSTGESQGKAGGYAIQGAGAIFAQRIDGSITNVIGLPLAELHDALREVDII